MPRLNLDTPPSDTMAHLRRIMKPLHDGGLPLRLLVSGTSMKHTQLFRWLQGTDPQPISQLEELLGAHGYELRIVPKGAPRS